MGDFTLVCVWMAAVVVIFWGVRGDFNRWRAWRFYPTRTTGLVRQPCDEVLRASNAPPSNARKPDWVRHELIRLSALMRGQSRRAVARTFNRLYFERFVSTQPPHSPNHSGCAKFPQRQQLIEPRIRPSWQLCQSIVQPLGRVKPIEFSGC